MNLGLYTNGFTPGETVTIDMPSASFDGMETTVVRPRPMDILPDDVVLVKNPADPAWVLRLHKSFLVKEGENSGQDRLDIAPAARVPASAGVVMW